MNCVKQCAQKPDFGHSVPEEPARQCPSSPLAVEVVGVAGRIENHVFLLEEDECIIAHKFNLSEIEIEG